MGKIVDFIIVADDHMEDYKKGVFHALNVLQNELNLDVEVHQVSKTCTVLYGREKEV